MTRLPGEEPRRFTLEVPEPAHEAVAEVIASPSSYLGPAANVTIIPVLPTDPEAAVPAPRAPAPRPYARVIAPRRKADRLTIELVAPKRLPRPISRLLAEAGVRTPAGWRARRRGVLGGRRRWTEIRVPREASPAAIVGFASEALAALAPAGVTGHWLAVLSRHGNLPSSLSG
jgi:hypothetical protein